MYLANWFALRNRQSANSQRAAQSENRRRIPHEYHVGDKVLIRREVGNPYLGKLARPTEGPFRITDISQLEINGTVEIRRSPSALERVNICRLSHYFEPSN